MAEQPENTAVQTPADPWMELFPLACLVSIDLAVPRFTVRDLLRLDVGSVIEAHWKEGTHLPVQANGRQIGWAEFEVIGDRLAVQVTELI
jgi:flagellar motor switch/type III secretory pathway protein FliN